MEVRNETRASLRVKQQKHNLDANNKFNQSVRIKEIKKKKRARSRRRILRGLYGLVTVRYRHVTFCFQYQLPLSDDRSSEYSEHARLQVNMWKSEA